MTEFEQAIIEYGRQQVHLIRYGPRGVSFCLKEGPLCADNPLMFYCSICKIEFNCRNILVGVNTSHKKGCKNLLMSMLRM